MKGLVKKVEKLEKEKVDSDSLIKLLLRKVDKKANDELLYLLVNDFEAAREQINKRHDKKYPKAKKEVSSKEDRS